MYLLQIHNDGEGRIKRHRIGYRISESILIPITRIHVSLSSPGTISMTEKHIKTNRKLSEIKEILLMWIDYNRLKFGTYYDSPSYCASRSYKSLPKKKFIIK